MKFYSDKFKCKKCAKDLKISIFRETAPPRGGSVDIDCPYCRNPQSFVSSGAWSSSETKPLDHLSATFGS
jgi:hypothetical protein